MYAVNQQLVFSTFKAFDIGGSISIHAFGAYYGLTASLMLSRHALLLMMYRLIQARALSTPHTCVYHPLLDSPRWWAGICPNHVKYKGLESEALYCCPLQRCSLVLCSSLRAA